MISWISPEIVLGRKIWSDGRKGSRVQENLDEFTKENWSNNSVTSNGHDGGVSGMDRLQWSSAIATVPVGVLRNRPRGC